MINQHISDTNMAYKVLIVEDEYIHRKLEKATLRAPEFDVHEAVNGQQALLAIKQHDFDVVLLDKRMPGLNGDEVCHRVRNELLKPLLPIIMVTGTNALNDLEKSLAAGANDFIRKPYAPMELVAKVRVFAEYKRMTDQLDSAESMLFALANMVEAKDENTGRHCARLEHMAEVFGTELGLDSRQLLALKRGGILHDIGKLGIPDSILLKNGPLTEDEWGVMQQHSNIGARLCSGLNSLKYTIPIIKHHHERFDGSGYPDGLKGEDIPYLARVFQIIDIYDALMIERPYKKAFPMEKIIQVFEEETVKGWRDPELVATFLKLLRSRSFDLCIPSKSTKSLGEQIFDDIAATGVLNWNREPHQVTN